MPHRPETGCSPRSQSPPEVFLASCLCPAMAKPISGFCRVHPPFTRRRTADHTSPTGVQLTCSGSRTCPADGWTGWTGWNWRSQQSRTPLPAGNLPPPVSSEHAMSAQSSTPARHAMPPGSGGGPTRIGETRTVLNRCRENRPTSMRRNIRPRTGVPPNLQRRNSGANSVGKRRIQREPTRSV